MFGNQHLKCKHLKCWLPKLAMGGGAYFDIPNNHFGVF